MSYRAMNKRDIESGAVFVSLRQVLKDTGIPRSTVNRHIHEDHIHALRWNNKTFFHPDEVAKYRQLFDAGLLGERERKRKVLPAHKPRRRKS